MGKERVLVTGGAGFIGSHLVDSLMKRGMSVVVIDDLSSGRLENIKHWLGNERFSFIKDSVLNYERLEEAMKGCYMVYHLAANSEVRAGQLDTKLDYEKNVYMTYSLLEAMRVSSHCKAIIFTSTSTVYGEAKVIPTPEDYGPLKPISLYGASKLACEALISGYSYMFGFRAVILRLVNILGPRCHHGVVYDFIRKLRSNNRRLEIMGDGSQSKSYLHIDDCIDALIHVVDHTKEAIDVYNVGSKDSVDVMTIARIIAEEMGLKGVELACDGGVDGGRGWKGDVKKMLLDTSKIRALGWSSRFESKEAIRLATREMLREELA